jgi:hypothetical protein
MTYPLLDETLVILAIGPSQMRNHVETIVFPESVKPGARPLA